MGQCVSRKAGAVIAASGHHDSPSYRIMDKPAKTQNDNKGTTKRGGAPCTRGTAMSFGFRRRPTSGIPMPTMSTYSTEMSLLQPRSKSAGPEQCRRRGGGGGGGGGGADDDLVGGDATEHHRAVRSSSGRSTPRLAPPRKEANGATTRTNRFGYRQTQTRFTNKVGDVCNSHSASHYNQEKLQQHQDVPFSAKQANRVVQVYNVTTSVASKTRQPPTTGIPAYGGGGGGGNAANLDANRRVSGIPEPIGRYTLHTKHLPLPQYAVRMNDANSKIAKTAANQSRKISTGSKSSASSKEGSGTEDSGVGSQQGYPGEQERIVGGGCLDYSDGSTTIGRRTSSFGRPRNLRMVVSGKSFDVRDVRDDDSTVTEISVIPLPKSFGNPNAVNTGMVRERATQYQRIVDKDNRYTNSTTSMSTTSSEGYDEGLGEEKVYKDRSHSEKIPSIKSDFSPPSSDDPEYGHGEAMADEYSFSSSDECQQQRSASTRHIKTISDAAKSGTLPKSTLRSVLLTIEDPAFAAVAATSTTLIDDETSPVDSLFDSPTASITQSADGGKISKKECPMERSGNTIEDDGPGTPTNASNSLSLSEGREYFDDEIADQPGLIFDDDSRAGMEPRSAVAAAAAAVSHPVTENSHTLVESTNSKSNLPHGKTVSNSPLHGGSGRRISRAGSVDTLSPCESIASDDLMLDYERSDASSNEETTHRRLDSNTALHELDDATILSELEAQGEEVMRQWTSLLGTAQPQLDSNSVNNNPNNGVSDNNNHSIADSGVANGRTSRLLRSRSGIESPRSLDSMRNRQIPSPLRTPKSIQSPILDSGDDGSIRIDRATFQYMCQDIVSLKTMLLKLKRVLQEPEALNPFDNSMKNGLFYALNEGGTADVSTSPGSGGNSIADELTDLRRQVIFLQGQVEDRDRSIQVLQFQLAKLKTSNGTETTNNALSVNGNKTSSSVDTCNATTQTEKQSRPVSAGPSLLQSLPQDNVMGPLVSWSDSWDCQHPTMLGEPKSNRNFRKSDDRSPFAPESRHSQSQIVKPDARRNFTRKSFGQENI